MPDRLSYDDAMLYADRNLKIQDTDIKQGAVETIIIKTVVGNLKKPWGLEGGFAVVYKFRTKSGQMKAMRCFRVAINLDTRSRYEKMSSFFYKHVSDITVDFRYYEDGILVKETQQSTQKTTRPVIVMEWVEGVTLLEKVDELCRQRDTLMLGQLAEQWLNLVNTMWQAHMAHGDLAGVNVMVRTNGQLALIDYDGVYIPEFVGLPQIVLGQQGYQHPKMHLRLFNEHMDEFSALVIYLSLVALQGQPQLWDRYVNRNTKGQLDGNMLFTRDDFEYPDTSPVFAELLRSQDSQVRDLTRVLWDACNQPNGHGCFPQDLRGTDYLKKQALRRLEQAIQQGDDDQIIQEWDTHLTSYTPAQQYEVDVEKARHRKAALDAFNHALASLDVFRIAAAATPELFASPGIAQHRRLIDLAKAFVDAYQSDDDTQIMDRWDEIQQGPLRGKLNLGHQERQRLKLAGERKDALMRFRGTVHSSNPTARMIIRSYDSILDGNPNLTAKERKQLDDARRYSDMYNKIRHALQMNYGRGDFAQFMAAYDEELDKRFNDFLPEERQQIINLSLYGKLDRALIARHDRLALLTAREIEKQNNAPMIDQQLMQRLREARENFMRGIEAKNVRVRVQDRQVFAYWDWPNDDLIERARLVWRSDRWPLHPQTDDRGRQELWSIRGVYKQYGCCQFSVEMTSQMYVQVYFVLKDSVGQTGERWIYSRGQESTSRFLVQIAI